MNPAEKRRRNGAHAQRRCAHMVERQRRRDAENAGCRLQQHDRKDQGRNVTVDGHDRLRGGSALSFEHALRRFAAARV
jgi:hypothetical protein